MAQIISLCCRLGANIDDERIRELVKHIRTLQGTYGLWEYEIKPHASRWVTYDLLTSLKNLDAETDWASLEPRTTFRAYSRQRKRF